MPPLVDVVPAWPPTATADRLRIAVVEGQGVGPEVVSASMIVLASVEQALSMNIDIVRAGHIGGTGPYGLSVDESATRFYEAAFAEGLPVLTGPAGGRFVYELRARFDLYVKLVPVRPLPALADASIVRPERLEGIDVLIVRDNVGGLYQGEFGRHDDGRAAYQTATYTADQVDRLLVVAMNAARRRRGRLAVVTKPGGVPAVSALWQERAKATSSTGVTVEVIEVDNACFQLVADPSRFDVVAAPNMLGDVVGDTAAVLLGSRGMAYSANFGPGGRSVFQTAHGSAHDIAGMDSANPVAQMFTLAWLLRDACGRDDAASAIEQAIVAALADGIRTPDVAGPESTIVGTRAFAEEVAARVAAPSVEETAGEMSTR